MAVTQFRRARGQKKYRCGECSVESFHHWIEANRAAGVRCPACGSRRMELVTTEAKQEAAAAQAIRVDGGTPSTTLPPDHARRKVV